MRTLLTEKLMSSVAVGRQTAADEGARNMSSRCQGRGTLESFFCPNLFDLVYHIRSMSFDLCIYHGGQWCDWKVTIAS